MGKIHFRVAMEMLKEQRIDDVVLCDTNLAQINQRWQRKVMTWRGVIQAKFIDAVIIATPTPTHAELVREALDFGKVVFCEKPLCNTYAEARQFCGCEDQLFVGYIERYNPVLRGVRQLLHDGTLGKLLYVTTSRLNNVPAELRRPEGLIFDLGVHDFDLLNQLIGPLDIRRVVRRELEGAVVFASIGLHAYPDVDGEIRISWIDLEKRRELDFYGSEASMHVDLISQSLKLQQHRSGAAELPHLFAGEPAKEEWRAFLKFATGGLLSIPDSLGFGALLCAEHAQLWGGVHV